MTAFDHDIGAWLEQFLAECGRQTNARRRDVPKLSYRQRRAEWSAIGLKGEQAREAMQRELERTRR